MYKTINCDAPDYLTTFFTFTSEIHTRLLRSSSTYHLYTPRPRHELFRHSFTFSGDSAWNSLPVNIQNTSNVKQFKSLYLRWFRNSATYLYYAMIHIQQKIYNAYQKCEFNVMTVLVYPIWLCTCVPGIYCSITLPLFYGTVYVILHWPLIWYWDPTTHL